MGRQKQLKAGSSKLRNGMRTTKPIIQDAAKGRGAGVLSSGVEDAGNEAI